MKLIAKPPTRADMPNWNWKARWLYRLDPRFRDICAAWKRNVESIVVSQAELVVIDAKTNIISERTVCAKAELIVALERLRLRREGHQS